MMMQTYIIKIKGIDEYYCGKTNDISKRFKQHKAEKKPHWFGYKYRKEWDTTISIDGDFEKEIKRAGVRFIYLLLTSPRSAS